MHVLYDPDPELEWSCGACPVPTRGPIIDMAGSHICADCLSAALDLINNYRKVLRLKDAKPKPEVEEVYLNQSDNVLE